MRPRRPLHKRRGRDALAECAGRRRMGFRPWSASRASEKLEGHDTTKGWHPARVRIESREAYGGPRCIQRKSYVDVRSGGENACGTLQQCHSEFAAVHQPQCSRETPAKEREQELQEPPQVARDCQAECARCRGGG